jgi:hypothetical protein
VAQDFNSQRRKVVGSRENERNEIGLRENERRGEKEVERRRKKCKLRHVS